jgi:hypothetical protein
LGVDEKSGEIVAAVLSSNSMGDGEVLPMLLEQVKEPIRQLSGDGGYDQRSCYQALQKRQQEQGQALKVTVPPHRGAHIWRHDNRKGERLARDQNKPEAYSASRAQTMETGKWLPSAFAD